MATHPSCRAAACNNRDSLTSRILAKWYGHYRKPIRPARHRETAARFDTAARLSRSAGDCRYGGGNLYVGKHDSRLNLQYVRPARVNLMQRRLLFMLVVVILAVVSAPFITPFDPLQTNTDALLQTPNAQHLLGTDHLGRDVFSRMMYGGQRTLLIATLATAFAVLPGLLFGLLAGSTSGWFDSIVMIFINAFLAFPGLLLALVVLTLIGQGALPLAIATGFAQIAAYARVTRSATITVKSMQYVEAAESLGATRWQVTIHHIMPNILPTLLAYASVVFSYSIINSAALSFLGLGGEPGIPDWGVMLSDGRSAFRLAPWGAFFPGLAITVTVMAANYFADQLTTQNTK